MKVYLVGGAVRDQIIGISPNDRDYVVVGATIEDMLMQGFRPIGRSFPVFIKKGSEEEYALARKEVKIGPKHTDFGCVFDKSITLEDDLIRRDFSCNAIAYDVEEKRFIDYHGGIEDIKNKILRHISPHFVEDPLRVIRLCRFAAQLGFSVAPETLELCRQIVLQDQLDTISPERIWGEIKKALQYPNFYRFIEVAHECFALKKILSAVEKLWSIRKNDKDKTLAEHVIHCLKCVSKDNEMVKFATLLHSIGETECFNSNTSIDDLEQNGVQIIKDICHSLKIPNNFRSFAVFVCKNRRKFADVDNMKIEQLLDFTDDYIKRTHADFENFIAICKATSNTNIGALEQKIKTIYDTLSTIKANQMPDFKNLQKDASFKAKYREFKLQTLKNILGSE